MKPVAPVAGQVRRGGGGAGLWPGLIGRLPKPILVAPMVVQWLWLSLLHRSATLPSAADPALETGGLVGESKLACLEQVGSAQRRWLARTIGILHDVADNGTAASPAAGVAGIAVAAIVRQLEAAGLGFPVVAKPDIGWCGYGVRRLDDAAALSAYLSAYPSGERLLLQEYLDLPGEAGLFYVRWPGESTGRVLTLTVRSPPQVTGDGRSTLGDLVGRDRRLRGHRERFAGLDRIPCAGEAVVLSTVWSHRMGGLYRDRSAAITPALERRIDAIACSMPDLHVARFDVRFGDLDALAAGEGFKIMEINGAGSEAIQLFDPDVPFFTAYRGVFDKQRMIFAIGAAMRVRGHRPCGWRALAAAHRHQQRLIARYPASN